MLNSLKREWQASKLDVIMFSVLGFMNATLLVGFVAHVILIVKELIKCL